jgi:peptidoglycan/LPS O-acetylase OafA/YrhL
LNSTPPVSRFYSLDALRGIAALSVVFWHWQHFFFIGVDLGPLDLAQLPLFRLLHLLYLRGRDAVDLFFSLSGFIFYWLYAKRIKGRSITPGQFAWLRFSRLYPLHFATLLLVAAGQYWLLRQKGSYFVYADNDAYHFVLNLLFANSWGLERGPSFNGPTWSVSVEVLLYIVFYGCCLALPIRATVLILLSLVGFFMVKSYEFEVGRGIGSFFAGGCAFLGYQAIVASRRFVAATRSVAAAALCAWAITFLFPHWVNVGSVVGPSHLHIVHEAMALWPMMVLFPVTILSLALMETQRGALGKRISFLGDISYSSYLLHFPLQLVIVAIVTRYTADRSMFYSIWFMAAFFAVLLVASLASFHYYEMPAQKFLRRLIHRGRRNRNASSSH